VVLCARPKALNEPERAAVVAQKAADRLPATAPLPQWARCYLADAEATRERDPQRAPHYIAHALATFMLVETLQTAARMQIAQAARLIDWQQFSEADTLLTQVAPHIAVAGDPVLSLHLTLQHARLAHAQQDLEQAQARVGAEIALGEQTLVEHATIDPATQAELHAALARLLQIAGLIAEEQGDLQTADAAFTRAISVLERDRSCLAADIAAAYADLLTARGDHVAAVRHYQVALRYQRWSAAQPV
jgi:tetratricopeptide (TPR) repeat protein